MPAGAVRRMLVTDPHTFGGTGHMNSTIHLRRRIVAAALALTVVISMVVLTSGTAEAAAQTKLLPAELSGSVPKQTIADTGLLVCDDCYPDALAGGTPTALGARAAINLDVKYVQ